jgi:hypothetical protein
MEKFVQLYLTNNYEIGTSEVGNDGIYSIEDKREIRAPIYGDKLVAEVVTVFSIDSDECKELINKWAITIKPDINLEFYWATVENILEGIFPIIQRVAARTIGMDLVSVQPIATPKGLLNYIGYNYSGGNQTQNYEIADNNAAERWENIQQIYENQQRLYGDLDHPDNI